MKDEKVTWESTGITYPTYLPPGVRYHRGPSSTSLSPPPPLVPAFASASRYLCKTEAGTDQVRQHPRSHLLLYAPSPSCASINPLDRTRGRRIKRSIPSTLPGPDQRRSAKIQVVARRWVPIRTLTRARRGRNRPWRRNVVFSGGVFTTWCLGFGFLDGLVAWCGSVGEFLAQDE